MDMKEYLVATYSIDSDHPAIGEKSRELTASLQSAKEKAIDLFYFVKDEMRYNVYADRTTDAHFKASYVLAKGEGYCVQKAVLLVALARAVGIPARLRFAEIRAHLASPDIVEKRGSNIFPCHGFADLYINDRWVKATPTYDLAYCRKIGVSTIRFNGEEDTMLPARTDDGRPNVDYLQDRGYFADLPLHEIRKVSLSSTYVIDPRK